jgi:small subunit ribosomal protein S6
MALYENVFIARQDVSGAQVETLTDGFAAIITENGGQVGKREYWGLRNLSYRMKKNRKGHYVLLNIDAPPAAVKEMERTMRINEDIVRFMSIRVDALEEGPSAFMQSRGSRDDRDRGDRDRGDRGDRYRRGDGERRDGAQAASSAPTASNAPASEGEER